MDRNEQARQESKEKIRKLMEENKCCFPGCERKVFSHVAMPVTRINKENKMELNPDVQLTQPACDYHFPIISSGLFSLLEHPEKKGQVMLWGPLDLIPVVESVVTGLIFSGQLQDTIKAKENADNIRKEMADKLEKENGSKDKDAEQEGNQ